MAKPLRITKDGKMVFKEDVEHVNFANYLTAKGFQYHHSPNEQMVNTTSQVNWMYKKAKMGTKSGYPDFEIFLPHTTVYIEMKRVDCTFSSCSHNQKYWLFFLDDRECSIATWSKGCNAAINFFENVVSGNITIGMTEWLKHKDKIMNKGI